MCNGSAMEHGTGTVKWFNAKKGYGFITTQDGSELFVHFTGILDEPGADTPKFKNLREGAKVKFNVDPNGKKGPQAVNVSAV